MVQRVTRGVFASLARSLALVALGVPAAALSGHAQEASPFVASDHWIHGALRRLGGLGLLAGEYDSGARSVAEHRVDRLLRGAVRAAAGTPYEEAARAYLDRFVEEFGDLWQAPAEPRSAVHLGGAFELGFAAVSGAVTGGSGYGNGVNWTGPSRIPSSDGLISTVELRGRFGRHLAGRVSGAVRSDSAVLGDAYALFGMGKVGAWLGRRAVGFGPAGGGGIVLSGAQAFTGGGVALVEGVTLPGVLRHLGVLRAETFLASVHENGEVTEPWFWAGRVSLQPHDRLIVGVNRAAMFGGAGNTRLRLRDVLYVMVGKHAGQGSEVDNQVAAVDVWYRVPISVVPLSVYAEWGFEDSAGAWKDVPGIVVGGEVASVPGLPGLSLGTERVSFAPSCCGNPIWYRHWRFLDGWAVDGRPLGHPLGGHGTEWRLSLRFDSWDARLRLRGDAFARDRGDENVFAPDRAGESRGGMLDVTLRLAPRFEVMVYGLHERGESGWRESRIETAGRVLLH